MPKIHHIRLLHIHQGTNVIADDKNATLTETPLGVYVSRPPPGGDELVPWPNVMRLWYVSKELPAEESSPEAGSSPPEELPSEVEPPLEGSRRSGRR